MTDPIPPASGDLEAVHLVLAEQIMATLTEEVSAFDAYDEDEMAALEAQVATLILSALHPANPPATAAGVGEAVAWRIRDGQPDGDWNYHDGHPHKPSALIQPLYTSPASHDALIATGCFECDTPLIGPLCPKCNPAHDPALIARVRTKEDRLRWAVVHVREVLDRLQFSANAADYNESRMSGIRVADRALLSDLPAAPGGEDRT